jgi:hypothetical protein
MEHGDILNGLPLIPILSVIIQFLLFDTYLFKIFSFKYCLHLCLDFPRGTFPAGLLGKILKPFWLHIQLI